MISCFISLFPFFTRVFQVSGL